MKWLDQLLCNHSWLLHYIYMPDKAMQLKTCTKCGKSGSIEIVEIKK